MALQGSNSEQLQIDVYLWIVLAFLFPVVGFVIWYYAEAGTPWHTYITVFSCYYSAFAIMLLVPIDVAAVIVDRRSTTTGFDEGYENNIDTIRPIYKTFFIILTVLASVVLGIEEYYNTSGYFTVASKSIGTMKLFFRDSSAAIVAGAIVFGILVSQKLVTGSNAFLLTVVLISNTVNLFLLMFILGYGLVAFPQMIWTSSNIDTSLDMAQQAVAATHTNWKNYKTDINQIVANVKKTKDKIGTYGDQALNDAISIIIGECPQENSSSSYSIGEVAVNKNGQVTIDSLAELRSNLKVARTNYRQTESKLEATKIYAYYLEDIQNAAKRKDGVKQINWSFSKTPSSTYEFYWHTTVRPLLLKFIAVVFVVLTIFSFLGMIGSMHGVSERVSVYWLAVHDDSGRTSGAGIVIFVLFTFGYVIYVTSWGLFKIKIAGLMELVPYRTTPESLSFNSRMVARLSSPLAFFYLGWIYENGTSNSGSWTYNNAPFIESITYNSTTGQNTTEVISQPIEMLSAFAKFYQIDVVPGIGDAFGTAFPIILYCVSFLVLTNLVNRILVATGMESYQFGAELVTDEQLRIGKEELRKSKKILSREANRYNLRNAIMGNTGKKPIEKGDAKDGAPKKTCWQSFCTSVFGVITDDEAIASLNAIEIDEGPREPPTLVDWVEKKGGKSFGMEGSYQRKYMQMGPPGILYYWKDEDTTKEPNGEVDVKLIVNFNMPPAKKSEDGIRLDLELPDKTFKMRFKSEVEALKWKEAIIQWKDYAIDFGDAVTNKPHGDIESTGRGSLSNVKDKKAGSGTAPVSSPDKGTSEDEEFMKDYDDLFSDMTIPSSSLAAAPTGQKGKSRPVPSASSTTAAAPATKPYGKAGASFSSVDSIPKPLEGWSEKKSHGMMSGWNKRYLRIDETNGSLSYYKTPKPGEAPAGAIDLRLIVDVSIDKEGKGDQCRFSVRTDDKEYHFKTASKADTQRWVNGIQEWKDYIILKV